MIYRRFRRLGVQSTLSACGVLQWSRYGTGIAYHIFSHIENRGISGMPRSRQAIATLMGIFIESTWFYMQPRTIGVPKETGKVTIACGRAYVSSPQNIQAETSG